MKGDIPEFDEGRCKWGPWTATNDGVVEYRDENIGVYFNDLNAPFVDTSRGIQLVEDYLCNVIVVLNSILDDIGGREYRPAHERRMQEHAKALEAAQNAVKEA